MGSRVVEAVEVELDPRRTEELWTNVRRWPAFVEGFRAATRVDEAWPREGSAVVWESIPGGRGTVTERVTERAPGERIVTQLFEERMTAVQTVVFVPAGERTAVHVELDYELTSGGPLRAVANALFIRRAISDALVRTLGRFSIEAAEEAALAAGGPPEPSGR
jgi:uncharacterized membrane protein